LKVDRSFVAGLDESNGDVAIVRAVVQLADALGLTSVGEGVETPDQLRVLRDLGCAQAQGYHIGRPVPIDDLLDQLGSFANGA
jgi:EAL domain-containing protein (putative c-di-GMP-specific phosphodiesterase class I)